MKPPRLVAPVRPFVDDLLAEHLFMLHGKKAEENEMGRNSHLSFLSSRRIVASLWKVDDEATGELMSLFYKEMLQEGRTPAAALRQAQLTMSQEGDWQSPFYWAAFVLQGEWM